MENKTEDWRREHWIPLWRRFTQCSLENKIRWIIIGGIMLIPWLLIARIFEVYFNEIEWIAYGIRLGLLHFCRWFRMIDWDKGRYIIKENDFNIIFYVMNYGDYKFSIRDKEEIEKALTRTINDAVIMSMGEEILRIIKGIIGRKGEIEIKGSINWYRLYLPLLRGFFGDIEECNNLLNEFSGDPRGQKGADTDAKFIKYDELSNAELDQIGDEFQRYFGNVCNGVRNMGNIQIDGDDEHYYVLDEDGQVNGEAYTAERLSSRVITSLFYSMSIEEIGSEYPYPAVKLYDSTGLLFTKEKPGFVLGRGKLRLRRINNETGLIEGYYYAELLDISCEFIENGIHETPDLSDKVRHNGLIWLSWIAYLTEVTRLKNDPRGDAARQQRMEERTRICNNINRIFGDLLTYADNNGYTFDGYVRVELERMVGLIRQLREWEEMNN